MTRARRPRWIGAAATIAVVVGTTLGCGGGSGDDATDVADTSAAATTPATSAEGNEPSTNSVPDETGEVLADVLAEAELERIEAGSATPAADVPLSDAQQVARDERGAPDRFVIELADADGPDGTAVELRLETWYYDDDGLALVWRNGELFTEREASAPADPAVVGTTALRPEQFGAETTTDELAAIVGEATYLSGPLDGSGSSETIVVLRGVVAGFDDGALQYVETIPLASR